MDPTLSELAQAPAELDAAASMLWAWSVEFIPRLGAALVLFVIGFLAAGWASGAIQRVLRRTRHVDETAIPAVGAAARYAILILVLIAALAQLGVQTASLLAVVGAAGLAIGLALQGTLQNIAAGIMLLYLRPFRVGEYIETATIAGIVKSVGLFVTELETFDGLYIFAPNSSIWNTTLKNHSRNARRMMSIQIGISYSSDPAKARSVLLELAGEDQRVLKEPAPYVYVETYAETAVVLTFRAWAATAVFWDVQRVMIEEAKRRLESAGIEIPFPQRLLHIVAPPGEENA
jgi:small conductance mechanosensitive channel